jgi:hypothetical protein
VRVHQRELAVEAGGQVGVLELLAVSGHDARHLHHLRTELTNCSMVRCIATARIAIFSSSWMCSSCDWCSNESESLARSTGVMATVLLTVGRVMRLSFDVASL